jgi:Immunity protein 52
MRRSRIFIMGKNSFSVTAYWNRRWESIGDSAEKFRLTLEAISGVCPHCEDWLVVDESRPGYGPDNQILHTVPLSQIGDRMAFLLEAGVSQVEDEEPEPSGGYYLSAINNDFLTPTSVALAFHGAFPRSNSFAGSSIRFSNDGSYGTDPQIVAFPVFRDIARVLARIWQPDYVQAGCSRLWDYRTRCGAPFGAASMVYLSPPLAARVTPPEGVLVERDPDGAMTLIAVAATFDVDNPAHLAGALAIQDATACLNPPD